MEALTQNCAYCGVAFVPRVRFVQKYCSASCKTLYCRHKCTREEYEARKAQASVPQVELALPTYTKELQRFLRMFLREYAGKSYTPEALQTSPLHGKLASILDYDLTPEERAWLTEIQTTVTDVSQFTPKNKAFQVRLKRTTKEAIEAYLSHAE